MLALSYATEMKENVAFVPLFLGFPGSCGRSVVHLLTASCKGGLSPRVLPTIVLMAAFVEGRSLHCVCGWAVLRRN